MPGAKRWRDEPLDHQFDAALDYLTLTMSADRADQLVKALRKVKTIRRRARDVLRASGLPLLPRENPRVTRDIEKMREGELLSPVLAIRGTPLVVADGYHRLCAAYWVDDDDEIPCRLVDLRP